MSPRTRWATTILSFAFFWTPQALSQGLGTIVGSVTDPSGGVVANAKVTATELETAPSGQSQPMPKGFM